MKCFLLHKEVGIATATGGNLAPETDFALPLFLSIRYKPPLFRLDLAKAITHLAGFPWGALWIWRAHSLTQVNSITTA